MTELQALKDIGFEDHEATIYLYLIKSGPITQQQIADETGLIRQTVYDVMKKMLAKGYISKSLQGKTKLYSPIGPEILLAHIKERQANFESILPALIKAQSKRQSVFSESFIGMDGLKNLFNLTLQSQTEVLWAADQNENGIVFKDFYWENYAVKRAENKVPLKLLLESPQKNPVYQSDPKTAREVRANPKLKGLHAAFAVFEDKVIFYATNKDQLFGVFIKNKEMQELMSLLFWQMWTEGKDPSRR